METSALSGSVLHAGLHQLYVSKEPAGPKIAESKGYIAALVLTMFGVVYIGVFPDHFINRALQAGTIMLPLYFFSNLRIILRKN